MLGVDSVTFDKETGLFTVRGKVDPNIIIEEFDKWGKKAVLLSPPSPSPFSVHKGHRIAHDSDSSDEDDECRCEVPSQSQASHPQNSLPPNFMVASTQRKKKGKFSWLCNLFGKKKEEERFSEVVNNNNNNYNNSSIFSMAAGIGGGGRFGYKYPRGPGRFNNMSNGGRAVPRREHPSYGPPPFFPPHPHRHPPPPPPPPPHDPYYYYGRTYPAPPPPPPPYGPPRYGYGYGYGYPQTIPYPSYYDYPQSIHYTSYWDNYVRD